MRNELLIAFVIGCSAIGCGTSTPPISTPPQSTVTQPIASVSPPRYGWYETDNGEAIHVLVTELTIPGLFESKKREIGIARYERVDAEGMTQLPPAIVGGLHEYADGRNEKGGFGYGGGISLVADEEHEDAIVLNVSYYWTRPDQQQGQLDEKVPVKIGVPLDVQLPSGCRLQVSWRS